MKLFTRLVCFLIVLGSFSASVSAQDIIIKKDGEKIKAKIIEINDTQVKYHEFRDINDLIFTIDRAIIKEIKFESGTKYKEERPGNDDLYYTEDRIHNLKLNFFAIGQGDLILTFERAINPGSSLEATLKFYGLGDGGDNNTNDSGIGLNAGYKFKFGNLFKKSGEYRPKHILHGGYFRPVVGYSWSKETFEFRSNRSSDTDSYVHFGIEIGKQWIVQNAVSIDVYFGYHYYGGAFTSTDPNADRFTRFNSIENGDLFGENNRAGAFGLRIGGLFTKKGIDGKKSRK